MRGVEVKGSARPRDAIGFPRRWTTGRIALVLALLLVLGLDPARYITHATASVPLRLTRSGQAHTTGILRAPATAHRAPLIRPAAITCTPNVSCSIDSSGGTLDHIVVGADTTVQVIYPSLSPDNGEIYPPDAGLGTEASCSADSGVWVLIAGTLYGPDFGNDTIHCGSTATGNVSPDVFFTPVSQVTSGSGTSSDPYTVVTTVSLGSGMTLVQRITYVVGTKYFLQTVTLSGNTAPATIYHGTDIYLLGSDSGYGYYDPITGAIGGRNVVNASNQPVDCSDPQAQPGTFYEVEVPDPGTPAQHYDEARYAQVWSDIQAGTQGTPLPDTVDTDVCEDNGTALEWDNVAAGSTIGDAMSFSLGGVVIPPTSTPTNTPTSTPTITQTPVNSPTTTSTPTATATVTTPCSTLTSTQPAAIFGANLILNPGAEAGPASADGNTVEPVPNWTTTGNFTVVCYGAPNFPSLTDPGPPNRGQAFFAGGPNNALSTASQTIDVSAVASQVDAGGVTFTLSGYLGGFDSQSDNAVLTASFIGAQAQILGTGTIGPVTVADRNGQTGLLFRSTTGALPVGTRGIQLLLTMTRSAGTYNDGYADNLSLVLNAPVAASPTTTSTPTATATIASVPSCALRVKPLPIPVNPTQQQQIVYTAPPGSTITTTFLASSAGGAPYPAQITVISQVGMRLTLYGAPVMVDGQAGYQYTFPLDSLGHAIVTFTIPPDATAQTVTILTSYQPSCVNRTTFQVL